MTDQNNPHDDRDFNHTIEAVPSDGPKRQGWSRRALFGGAIAGLVVGAGLLAVTGNGFARGGDRMHGFIEYRIEKALEDVDATDEQTAKVKAIFTQVRTELSPMAGGFRDTRDAFTALLESPTIDRAEIEKLRAERLGALDEASRRVASAIADVAEILTPEQRKQLVEEMRERRGHRW